VQIGTDTNWSMISVDPMDNFGFSSYGHSVAIKTNGTLWAWGENADGQLGNGLTANTSSPVQVGSGSTGPWTKAACARRATIGIQQDGTMWSWGSSLFGILGRTGASSSSPIQIGTLTGWTEIKCGEDHALAKKSDGTLWSWGRNSFGELGLQDIVARSSPVQIGANTDWGKISTSIDASFATRTDNTLWGWGENVNSVLDNSSSRKSSPVQIGTGAGWTAAEGGHNHLIALTTTGTLWARGLATNGQLGVGTFPTLVGGLTNPTQITGITASSLARNCSTLSNLKGFLKRK
jgi:alpha-tubulin suppressor-like RCC1 family protein